MKRAQTMSDKNKVGFLTDGGTILRFADVLERQDFNHKSLPPCLLWKTIFRRILSWRKAASRISTKYMPSSQPVRYAHFTQNKFLTCNP
jgi:hypothetical protein